MDVVDGSHFPIARNCFIRNSNFVSILVAYISIQVSGFERLIAADSFFPRTRNTTSAIICWKANLDKFYPYNRSGITQHSTHVVFAHMKNPFIFTSCKNSCGDELRSNYSASGIVVWVQFKIQPWRFFLFSNDQVTCSHGSDFVFWSALVLF